MEQEQTLRDGSVEGIERVAYVLKDRSTKLDGKTLRDPTFESFLPHIATLDIGGAGVSIDTSRNNSELLNDDGDPHWKHRETQREIALEEIGEELAKMNPGQTEAAKTARKESLEKYFGTRSWKAVEQLKLDQLQDARNRIWVDSRGHKYGDQPPAAEPANEVLQPGANDPPKTEAAA
jgi:hypothetical protein